jgi:ubiquinone/menaquinone biosynthesis C-methylase UbiE
MNQSIADEIVQHNLELHEHEAGIYDAIHPEILGEWEQRRIERDLAIISSALQRRPQPRVLDLGCGTGNLTLKFLQRGYSVRAVDISPQMLQQLRLKVRARDLGRLELVVADAQAIVGDARTYGCWDLVSFCSVLHHLPTYDIALADALHQLRPGGVLYVCHEPVRRTESQRKNSVESLMPTALRSVDDAYIRMRKLAVYASAWLRTGRPLRRTDYSVSDYHARTGIDTETLLVELEREGMSILLFERYPSFFSNLIASLDARFQVSPLTHFRLAVQRKARKQGPLQAEPRSNGVAVRSRASTTRGDGELF